MKSKINNARSERSRNNGRIIQLMIESLSVVLERNENNNLIFHSENERSPWIKRQYE